MKTFTRLCLLLLLFASCSTNKKSSELANTILNDKTLDVVDSMAVSLIQSGFNAGSGYSQIWARDFNTFIETACDVTSQTDVRNALLIFFKLQQPNYEIIDGYVVKKDFTWEDNRPYYSKNDTIHVGFKNTVETDQETSLIQAIAKYIRKTNDKSILKEEIAGITVLQRINLMIDYLLKEKYSEKYGLIYGAMTADWGDVQPNDDDVVDFNENSSPCIDVYDNAMLIIALEDLMEIAPNNSRNAEFSKLRDQIFNNTRKYLWDSKENKFIPHIYLKDSPVPKDFDESKVYYHGGTAIAIEAGLLSKEEIRISNEKMLKNVELSGMASIGLTIYPVYPDDFFRGGMSKSYIYQNGGDWTWFGGRMIQQLIKNGFTQEAYDEVRPMIDRVIKNEGFYEWYGQGNVPSGSGAFRGSAGVLHKAIKMFKDWANENK